MSVFFCVFVASCVFIRDRLGLCVSALVRVVLPALLRVVRYFSLRVCCHKAIFRRRWDAMTKQKIRLGPKEGFVIIT